MVDWGGRPQAHSAPSPYKKGSLSAFVVFQFNPFPSFAMVRGRGDGHPSAEATRSSSRQRAAVVKEEPDAQGEGHAWGGGAGRGRGRRGGRGRGGRGRGTPATSPSPPPSPPASSSDHVGDTVLEFILQLREPPCSRLHLPEAFARVLEIDQPPRLRLHMKGCCNGDMWVNTRFLVPHVMLL